jgi:type IV fimbrial biogenesis protein FimT
MLVRPLYRNSETGYTVVELLVAVAIVAIAMTVAVPSFIDFQRSASLSSSASNLVAVLNNARSEAMARGISTRVQPAGTGWGSGVVSFVDVDGSGNPSTQNITLATQPAFPDFVTITGVAAIKFEPSGFAPSLWGTLTLERNDLVESARPQQSRRLDVARTGRVKVCKPSSQSDPVCPVTSSAN